MDTALRFPSTGPDLEQIRRNPYTPAPHLVNNGGKILDHPTFISIYYGQYWNGAKGKAEASYLDSFGDFLVHSPHMATWAEYGVKSANYGGSSLVRGSGARTIGEEEIRQIVAAEIQNKAVISPDGQTVYTVYLPPGTELRASDGTSSYDGMGGYHGSYVDKFGTPVYYAAIVYSHGENGVQFSAQARDNITIASSHEWTEAATDPDVNRDEPGWYDNRYGEIGDIPISMGLPSNQIWGRMGGYAVQKEWSNKDHVAELVPKK